MILVKDKEVFDRLFQYKTTGPTFEKEGSL